MGVKMFGPTKSHTLCHSMSSKSFGRYPKLCRGLGKARNKSMLKLQKKSKSCPYNTDAAAAMQL